MTPLEKVGLLQLLPKMTKIDAMTCRETFIKAYGSKEFNLDWHDFSNYLSELETTGILKVVKPGGITGYALNREKN
jgi:hypothetical protein